MAIGILTKMLEDNGNQNIEVKSAGVRAVFGKPASDIAMQVSGNHGINLGEHRSQPVSQELMDWADWVIVMTPGQQEMLKKQYPQKVESIILLKGLGRPDPRPEDLEVRDPFGSDYWGYERSFLEIAAEIERILPYLNG